MFQSVMLSIKRNIVFYKSYLSKEWNELTPEMYAALLISILVVGWLMMRSSTNKI